MFFLFPSRCRHDAKDSPSKMHNRSFWNSNNNNKTDACSVQVSLIVSMIRIYKNKVQNYCKTDFFGKKKTKSKRSLFGSVSRFCGYRFYKWLCTSLWGQCTCETHSYNLNKAINGLFCGFSTFFFIFLNASTLCVLCNERN